MSASSLADPFAASLCVQPGEGGAAQVVGLVVVGFDGKCAHLVGVDGGAAEGLKAVAFDPHLTQSNTIKYNQTQSNTIKCNQHRAQESWQRVVYCTTSP